ncbi:Uu.00g085050.m01.CDS01 [Anthostomella pinea]|uniref:Uu.00g085050.m01.CDS01 n=1 Tax=Anthostomella pinea TaxID=933095 RepID=A0AAI8YHC8_9PEZI|nr:Uu.00g085050.m01.CDS01 [Anthostomella pinea]
MSGFEIAGVVLGVIPLLISAIEDYKSGKSTMAAFVQYRGHLETLTFRLKYQKLAFYFDILELLRSAQVREAEIGADMTEQECLMVLNDAKNGTQVREYLGIHYDAFIGVLRRYEECLQTIARKLRHITRLPQMAKDDLQALITANPPINGKFDFKGGVSFTMRRDALKGLVEELKEDRLSLKVILKGTRTQHERAISNPSNDSRILAGALRKFQAYAKTLFGAMCRSCACACQGEHKVLLQLHNRVMQPNTTKTPRVKPPDAAAFNLIFDLGDYLQEASVKANHPNPVSRVAFVDHDVSQVEPCHRDLCVENATTSHVRGKPSSICDMAARARITGSVLNLVMDGGSFDLIEGPLESQRKLEASTTLENFLRIANPTALDIAASIIQLQQTDWSDPSLCSKVVKFVVPKGCNNVTSSSVPYVEQTPVSQPMNNTTGPDPKMVLTEIAILLSEIWHHKPLEMWAAEAGVDNTTTTEARMVAAIRWFQVTSERLPPHHFDAIEHCLEICAGRPRYWHEEEFLWLYCENIIKPLQNSCKTWEVAGPYALSVREWVGLVMLDSHGEVLVAPRCGSEFSLD